MSGTSALLNLLEGSGSALLNAPEATKNGVSESDSSYFVSLMKQYEVAEGSEDADVRSAKEGETELLGNGLPMMPAVIAPAPEMRVPVMPAAVEIEADTRLEEFAVGLGIDRELARLLLRETSVPSAMGDVLSSCFSPSDHRIRRHSIPGHSRRRSCSNEWHQLHRCLPEQRSRFRSDSY